MCCTFSYLQYAVNDATEHVADVSHYPAHAVICNTEDISANYHRVHEANVSGSWETQTGNKLTQISGDKAINCAKQRVKREIYELTNTFHYIQHSVQYGTEHTLDVANHATHELISNTEDTSAYYHRVNVAKIKFSWENTRGIREAVKRQLKETRQTHKSDTSRETWNKYLYLNPVLCPVLYPQQHRARPWWSPLIRPWSH